MRTCECGNQVANNAKLCPKCGHRFTSPITKFVAGVFVFIFVIMVIGILSNSGDKTPPQTSPAPAPVSQSMSTGNEASDRLSALPARQQALFLSATVGEGCTGNRAFYMGSSPKDRSAFWSVGCANGKSYLVQVNADATGSTTVLECSVYKLVTKLSCFTKLKN